MIDLQNYSYLTTPPFSGDLAQDARQLLEQNQKAKTFAHSEAVAHMAAEIGREHGLDAELCETSGYLHDISAVLTPEDMLAYEKSQHAWLDEAELAYPFLLHQRLSKEIAERYFNISNERVLTAIGCHTTLRAEASDYDMTLFIADKLAWDRAGIPPYYEEIRRLAASSLSQACAVYIDYIFAHQMVLYPHTWLIEACNWLKEVS